MHKISIFLYSLLVSTLCASEFSQTLSNQGFTGIINTPNAQVMHEGDMTFHFDNQFDNVLRGYDYNREYDKNENYIFGVGLFPYFELQGRLSETPGYHRDLSANMKFQVPYTHQYLPNVAFGIQDIGSAANFYGNKYVVIDKKLGFVRASLGYGVSDAVLENKKRMDGFFGGVEVQAFDWLYLLAENDSVENFVGARVEMPKAWSSNFKLNTLITSNLSDDRQTNISLNLTFPLLENTQSYSAHSTIKYAQEVYDNKAHDQKVSNHQNKNESNGDENSDDKNKAEDPEVAENTENKEITLSDVQKRLEEFGIENISIARKNSTIYLGYENGVFLANDLDALGVTIGLLSQTKYKKFIVEQKRSKTVVISLSGDLDKARNFYQNPNSSTKQQFSNSLKKQSPADISTYKIFVEKANDSFLKPKIELSPQVRTFVGTEFGVFNYKLWLRTKAQINLSDGVDITAVGDIHVHDSQIDDPSYDWFMRLYENNSHMESVMLHKSDNILTGINTLSMGTFEENYAGAIDQYIYNNGNHTIKLKAGYFKEFKDGDAYKEQFLGNFDTRELLLAKYSYLFEDYDTLGEINFGKYWNQDLGFDVKAKKFFGDVAVYVAYQQSEANSIFAEQNDRYAGIGIEIPLTPRHTPIHNIGQISGTKAFNYLVKSTILREDGTNNIVPGSNYDPEVALSSENHFYNRNRLQLSYIKRHLFRLKESYDKYIK